MTNPALISLQQAVASAAGGDPFALDAAFLRDGMGDAPVAVPAGYDDNLRAAFQVSAAADFLVRVAASGVGPVQDDRFTVTGASVPFIGASLQGTATLLFSLTEDGSTLVVQVRSAPPRWTWTTSFPAMKGFPFDQLAVSGTWFVFSTASGTYPWRDPAGQAVAAGPTQNFFSSVPLPAAALPLLSLFDGLRPPSGALDFRGALDLSAYNGAPVLYPSGALSGVLGEGGYPLLYLQVSRPRLSLTITPPANAGGSTVGDVTQRAALWLAADLAVGGTGPAAYALQVSVPPPRSGGATRDDYAITLAETGQGRQLSPASVAELVGGGSYFGAVPPVLQQFLAAVGLQGLSLAGQLGTVPTVRSAAVQIGSAKGTSWTPIPDAPPGLDFTFTSFSLLWTVLNPFTAAIRQQSFTFTTQFTLAPEVFKGRTPQQDGIFTVSFTSDLLFTASFDGVAQLSDFLATLSGGAVSLPPSIRASLSDIAAEVDYNGRSFGFSSGYAVALTFLEVGGEPILSISNGRVNLAAMTPTTAGARSIVWQSAIAGTLAVGPVGADVSVAYDGFQTPPRWLLSASLARELDVEEVVGQFFAAGGVYDFPGFLPGDLKILALSIQASLPSGQGGGATTYTVDTRFRWLFTFGDQQVGIDPARLMLAYDGAKPAGQQFSGLAEGTWVYTAINLKLLFGYQFIPTAQGGNKILYVQWEGFRAEYESGKQQVAFSLKGWSLGSLIQALVRTLGDPYFTLPSPWDLLDQVSLDGLRILVSLQSGVQNRLSAEYRLSQPLNLGFIVINALVFVRDTTGKVTLAIDGKIPAPLLAGVPPADQQKLTNLTTPSAGQDVRNLPQIPGRGESYFKVFLLVLGQKVGITGYQGFTSTQQAIRALEGVPETRDPRNPVNPNANQGTQNGVPYYDPSSNWLIAGHLGLLQVAGVWTVDAMLVFNDPTLYALRLAMAGPRAGGLAGLAVDILYKKITDDVGLFQIDFTFPDSIRNLNFGAVSVTLPQIGIKVYTNGDFLIDVGFPYNLDFRRSFSFSAIVYGVPVLGSGGLYFGKLSNATAAGSFVPKTTRGTFDPVIVFGVGLQLGLGYNFTKGPLSAGFALTVFGIVEGVIAAWHPYDEGAQAVARASEGSLQSEYFFRVSGTVGIIGLLYGKIDFAIIQASVNVRITLSLQITYESYRPVPIVAKATVDVSVTVKIDLGLFSISISLSFSASISATFVIDSPQGNVAPWDEGSGQAATRSRLAFTSGPAAARLRAGRVAARPKRVVFQAEETKPQLNVLVAPQFTVAAPQGSASAAAQQGAFVFLFAMDAPRATGPATGGTSFEKLSEAFFPWVIDALGTPRGDQVHLAAASETVVDREALEDYVHALADTASPPLSITSYLEFLRSAFTLNVETPAGAGASGTRAAIEAGATLFPVFDGLSLTVPAASGSGTAGVAFETYTTTTKAYRGRVAAIFAEVEAELEAQNADGGGPPRLASTEETPESMASVVFTDTFAIIGRQLLQAALDALQSYTLRLQGSESIADLVAWAAAHSGGRSALTPGDVALPNQDHPLTAALPITLPSLSHAVQGTDTLASVAARYSDPATENARWTTEPAALVMANGDARILQPDVKIPLAGKDGPVDYVTGPGDSFSHMAAELGITLDALARQSALYGVEKLLSPAGAMAIPPIAYTTQGTAGSTPSADTLASLATSFATTVQALTERNLEVGGIFSRDAEGGMVTLAGLQALRVGDLWSAVRDTGQVAQTAGMVARFLMYGLRLPKEDGLVLSDPFLYPADQTEYALYQLTGQQFPTPAALTGAYTVTVARAEASHGVGLDFVTFDGAAGTRAQADLTEAYGRLAIVLGWARTGAFQPSPSFQALAATARDPQAFAAGNFALWSTSDMGELLALTRRETAPAAGTGAQPQPLLWPLPPSLAALASTRQAALEPLFPDPERPGRADLEAVLTLLPRFRPQVGSTSPSSGETRYIDVERWSWATRVDFQVKRLPAPEVAAAQGTGAGSEPSGPASAAYLPNVYEMVGPSSEDALLLERLLTAMDQLGTGIAPGLFLLYAPGGTATPTLVSLASQEFLAFITQTNLSTETNPEIAARLLALDETEAAPRGIANPTGEFIKLLWELSVVRSGGYYLYWETAGGGEGLPASLFDTTGTGTMTMVVVLQDPVDEAVPDYVNAFVTTDPIDTARDVVRLVSVAAREEGAKLGGSETLAGLAATYGTGIGALAAANAGEPLAAGTVVPVTGIVHQLTQADMAAPAPLDAVAAYYSAGAVEPLTGAGIQGYNPGTAVAPGAVFLIPPFEYRVSASAAPTDRLGTMAAYYGLSLDALAVSLRGAPGLLSAGTRPWVETQRFDLRATLPEGNVTFMLERENYGDPVLPPNPTDAQKADYARAYLFSLYNTLSAGFAANPYFDASPWGLPFGPQTHGDGAAGAEAAFASAARRMEARRLRLEQAALDPFDYRQSLGLHTFPRVNAAPEGGEGLPSHADNPYAGVGTVAQVALRWQDLFGNTTVTPFEAPPPGYAGALSGAPAPVRYGDRLIGVSNWTNVKSSYVYRVDGGSASLAADFALDPTSYEADPSQAVLDLALFTRVYFQLHQDYTGLGVPGVTGNAVSMRLANSLMARPETALDEGQAGVVRAFVADVVRWLATVAALPAGDPLPAAPAATLSLPVSPSGVRDGNILELDVTLVFERQALLTDPAVAALDEGLQVASPILPRPDAGGTAAYTTFAAGFEAVFRTERWWMRVGEGLREAAAGQARRTQQLWAVRFGEAEGDGIHFVIGDTPSYYAPKPVALSLESRSVQVVEYGTGQTVTSTFTGVDQNLWFQSVLDAVDAFLSARYSSSAFILDKRLGTEDPLEDGYLGRVLKAKAALADEISATVRPVLSTSADDESTRHAAREKLRQQLLNQLGAAYGAGTVTVFGLSEVSGVPLAGPAGPASLYGQPRGTVPGTAANQNFSLTASRIPLGVTTVRTGTEEFTFDPRVAFVFTSKNVADRAYVPLEALALEVSHLEFDRTEVPGIEGYVQSRWLAFVNGPFSCALGKATANVPVVNRMLPTPPTVQRQSASRHDDVPPTAGDLPLWDYRFEYLYPQAAQDLVQGTIQLNLQSQTGVRALAEQADLFGALAQFVTAYPAILADFNAFLLRVNAQAPDPAVEQQAEKAVSAFAGYLEGVATAYAGTMRGVAAMALRAAPAVIEVDFSSRLTQDGPGFAVTEIVTARIDGVAARYDRATGTFTNGSVSVPAVTVEILPDLFQAVAVDPTPPGVVVAYRYAAHDGSGDLPWEQAKDVSTRTVAMYALNVLAHQSAWSSIFVQRNKILFPVQDIGSVSTTADFLFQTPVVKFADAIVPRLSYAAFPLVAGASYEAELDAFFAALFAEGNGSTTVDVSMTAAYSYQLAPGSTLLPRVSLPVVMMPPVEAQVNPLAPPAFVAAFAEAVDGWRRRTGPTLQGSPQLNAIVQVFGTAAARQPLLTIANLYSQVTGPVQAPAGAGAEGA
jgi:hypothetical protein